MSHRNANASPQVQQAAALDAAGNHDGAIDMLATATRAGDLDAMVALGKRLMVGDRAPYLPKDGAGLVLEAASKRNAEALAQQAALQCIGLYQRKDWRAALGTLGKAAQLGWQPARAQLMLLARHDDSSPVDPPARDSRAAERDAVQVGALAQSIDIGDWTAFAQRIDIDAWMRIPPARTLAEGPRIVAIAGFIPRAWCRHFIALAAARLQPALVYDATSTRNYRPQTRTNSIAEFNLVENEVLHFLLQERMSRACGVPMQHMEGSAILNYQPGQEIGNHYDFVAPELPNYREEIAVNGQRIVTFLVYLNDDYDDGATVFPEIGLRNKGTAGEGLYFVNALPDGSPDLRTLHAGTAPRRAEKWIVSQFIRDRPVKYVL
ncbi:MAG: prolyl hydroxylase family protein [Gammaproteobacteria bacterium]